MPAQYAKVSWSAEDVQTLRPNWSLELCEEFLLNDGKYLRDRLVELGWDVMETLLTLFEKDNPNAPQASDAS